MDTNIASMKLVEFAQGIKADLSQWMITGSVDEQQSVCAIKTTGTDIEDHDILYECDSFTIECDGDEDVLYLWIGYDSDLYSRYNDDTTRAELERKVIALGIQSDEL